MNNEKNKVFAVAMFVLFAVVMITSSNYSMAKNAESGKDGGDNKGGQDKGNDNGNGTADMNKNKKKRNKAIGITKKKISKNLKTKS